MLASSSSFLQANLFEVTCTGICNAVTDNLANQIETSVNDELPDAEPSTYLKSMANASVQSGRHLGLDYASDQDFILAATVGAGIDLGGQKLDDLLSGDIKGKQIRGIGAQTSFMFGLNLKVFNLKKRKKFDPNRLTIFLNYGGLNKSFSENEIRSQNLGVHFRYKLMKPYAILPNRMIHWNGLDIATGFGFQALEVFIKDEQNQTFNADAGGGLTSTATIAGDVTARVKSRTSSTPLEIASGMQFAYFFSFYLGLGLDHNFGFSEAIASGTAPITTTNLPNTTELMANLNLGEKSKPDQLGMRWFTGVQFNFPFVKIASIRLDKDFVSKSWSLGARILTVAW